MFNLIPVSLLITAIGGIVYIVSNHLSEFSATGEDNEENGDNFQFNFKARIALWVNQLPLDNIKNQSLSLTHKLLHRFRLALLKTDNHLMKLISKISQRDKMTNGNASDFWEEFTKKKNEEQITIPAAEPEVKIDLAIKSEPAKKFFDIQPAKIFSEISEDKHVKKNLKIKKSPK